MVDNLIAIPYKDWRKNADNYAEILQRLTAIEEHVRHIRYGDGQAYQTAMLREQAAYPDDIPQSQWDQGRINYALAEQEETLRRQERAKPDSV